MSPELRTLPIEKCPLCGTAIASSTPASLAPDTTLRRCSECALVFASECAAPDEIYIDGYLSGRSQFGADTTTPWMQAHLESIAQQRCEIIERETSAGRRLLDVGCGPGHFLKVAQSRGWDVQGIEPVDESARRARDEFGLDVRASTLEESGLPEQSYDVVSLFHVIEHMQDATAFLSMVMRWARPGGFVVVEVPNFASIARRRDRERWIHLRPLEHVAHFTPRTVDQLFRRTGMHRWRVRTPTWIGAPLTTRQVTDLFGLPDLGPASRRLSELTEFAGEKALRPTAAGWKVWSGVESIYSLLRTGGLILGIAQVPPAPDGSQSGR